MELCTEGSLYSILDNPENACGLPEEQFFLVLRDVGEWVGYFFFFCTRFLTCYVQMNIVNLFYSGLFPKTCNDHIYKQMNQKSHLYQFMTFPL